MKKRWIVGIVFCVFLTGCYSGPYYKGKPQLGNPDAGAAIDGNDVANNGYNNVEISVTPAPAPVVIDTSDGAYYQDYYRRPTVYNYQWVPALVAAPILYESWHRHHWRRHDHRYW